MKQIKLKIDGMSCAACSSSIERSLRRKDFIHKIEVDLITQSAIVVYDEAKSETKNIIALIEKLGYHAQMFTNTTKQTKNNNDYLLAICFAIPLFVLSMGGMFLDEAFLRANIKIICALEILLLLPILYAGRKIYTKGFHALFKLVPNMDTLVMLGSGSAIVYSLYMLDSISTMLLHNLYFESAGVIIAVILLGKKLESNATNRVKSALDSIVDLAPKVVLKQVASEIISTNIQNISIGDKIITPKGAMFSFDCILEDEQCLVDESIITGESKSKIKQKGQLIYGGSINKSEQVGAIVKATAQDSMIGRIISLMQDVKKAPIARIADKISAYFVPCVIILSLVAASVCFVFTNDIHNSFVILASTLLISCPCALGLATPLSIFIATSIAAKKGFYFKNANSLENASKVDTIIFDKTGTLTTGKLEVSEFRLLDSIFDLNYILSLVYALENKSEHLIAKAILAYIKKEVSILHFEAKNVKTFTGNGIQGEVDSKEIKIGNLNFISNAKAQSSPHTICYISINGAYCAYFVLTNSLRNNAKALIAHLKTNRITSIILSGDSKESVESVAKACGIEIYHHSQLPQDKLAFIQNLQQKGHFVGFIGDGVNDALAIKQANIGISLVTANDIAIKESDILLLNDDLMSLNKALALSKHTLTNIKQNLGFAFIYNIFAIPIAAGIPTIFGLKITLTPMIAGIAMGLSSLSVVLNSLRLYKFSKD